MYYTIFSNIFIIGFYLYYYNKFCSNYLKTHFIKSLLCILYFIYIYNIITIDYVVKNMIICSFVFIIVYENNYIDKKIEYFNNNENVKKIQSYLVDKYDKSIVYLNYIFMFYDKLVDFFKKDFLKIVDNNNIDSNNDNEEMLIMFDKMKEMMNEINNELKIKDFGKENNDLKKINNIDNVLKMNDDKPNNIMMDEFLNNIISEMKPFINNSINVKDIYDNKNEIDISKNNIDNTDLNSDDERIDDYIE